ncbi:hypothetical protein CRG98_034224 [Punica granatum]|uniref:Reverse transcriptase domain-containing protein n=1 Tax=Punica granatum TaxID=22663 RepID=A0A2I0IN27_PUNGR|nr:hypothetical protein CRG98_034224 [Punica granatum]
MVIFAIYLGWGILKIYWRMLSYKTIPGLETSLHGQIKRTEGFIARKLDRVLVNEFWLGHFPSSTVGFQAPLISAHSLSITPVISSYVLTKSSFKFFNFWAAHPKFEEVVTRRWNENIRGNPMYIFYSKLKKSRKDLREFNKDNFSDISKRVEEAESHLEEIQSKILGGDQSPALLTAEHTLNKAYVELRSAEESFYPKDISQEAVDFYQKLLGAVDPHVSGAEVSTLQEILNYNHTEEQRSFLSRQVTEMEIKDALWSMDGDRAPGLDGYSAHFFKASWAIIGKDFISTVMNFFTSGKLLKEVNSTCITLVPKVPNPSKMSKFRSILW